MTTEEKIAMVHGGSTQDYFGRVPENTRLGIPAFITQDEPARVAWLPDTRQIRRV